MRVGELTTTGWTTVTPPFKNTSPPFDVLLTSRTTVLVAFPKPAPEVMPREPWYRLTLPVNVLTFVRLNPLVFPELPAVKRIGVVRPGAELRTPLSVRVEP